MTLDAELLKILVDPLSKQPLDLVTGKDGKPRLRCAANGLHYRIEEPDIPVLLIDEAELENGASAKDLVAKLRAAVGAQRAAPETQGATRHAPTAPNARIS